MIAGVLPPLKNKRAHGEGRTPLTLLRIKAEREHGLEPTCASCAQYHPPPRSLAHHTVRADQGRCSATGEVQVSRGVCLHWVHR